MKVVALFSGCGGLDLGLVKSGHTIVHASDIDKDSCTTYNKNFKHKCHNIDVKLLQSKDLPKYDLLVGGFPCQGFSVANLYRDVTDTRNELYLEIVRILTETTPNYFLAENVPGILSLGEGEVVKMIVNDFKNIGKKQKYVGYDVRVFLLNSAYYGVPQVRKRVIFLGVSNKIPKSEREMLFSNFPPKAKFDDKNLKLKPFKSLKDAIGDLPEPNTPEGSRILNHIGLNHRVKLNGFIGNRKLNWMKPGPTIVGRGGGTGGPVIAVHPNLQRRFTIRETARIQSFPDNFEFFGSISSQFRQIGNAVPVLMAYEIGKVLRDFELGKLKINKPIQTEILFD